MRTERDELLAEIARIAVLVDRAPNRAEILKQIRQWMDQDDGPPAEVRWLVTRAFGLDRNGGNGAAASWPTP
jgi:hypothetical protein